MHVKQCIAMCQLLSRYNKVKGKKVKTMKIHTMTMITGSTVKINKTTNIAKQLLELL